MNDDPFDALRRLTEGSDADTPFLRWWASYQPPRNLTAYFIPHPGGLPMQQTKAPTTTYLDELLAISTSTFDTALSAGRTQKEAYRAAMGMVAARVKDDIQRELRADRWHTAATVLDLWSAERGLPLDTGGEA